MSTEPLLPSFVSPTQRPEPRNLYAIIWSSDLITIPPSVIRFFYVLSVACATVTIVWVHEAYPNLELVGSQPSSDILQLTLSKASTNISPLAPLLRRTVLYPLPRLLGRVF